LLPNTSPESRIVQHLLIDADDTLWENNIYFERAFDEFVAYLDHSSMTPQQVRAVLDEIEEANNRIHGYGSLNFGRNLRQCYERLCQRDVGPEDLALVMSFAERILDCPMEVIEGVSETLEYLSLRHDLTVFTKGNPEEQKLKIERSGLGAFFGHTAIVKEKDTAAYRQLVDERKLNPEWTWMVGNSPKSDINPAMEAGLGAVFVPHQHTWMLEREDIKKEGPRLLIVDCFSDLRARF
jgi:putative hydrolase of the HAD superfamily